MSMIPYSDEDYMATKECLSHLEELAQTNADEIKSSFKKIDEIYKETILRQAAIIEAQQDANAKLQHHLVTMDRKKMEQDEKINNQVYIIAKLNADVRQKEEKISQCHTVVEEKNQVILHLTGKKAAGDQQGALPAAAIDQIRDLFEEFRGELKRKRGDGDGV